jgi:hypothetical protein
MLQCQCDRSLRPFVYQKSFGVMDHASDVLPNLSGRSMYQEANRRERKPTVTTLGVLDLRQRGGGNDGARGCVRWRRERWISVNGDSSSHGEEEGAVVKLRVV